MTETPPVVAREPRYRRDTTMPAGVGPRWHLDGIEWSDTESPPRVHEHWCQTVGELRTFLFVARCGCGSVAYLDRWPHLVWVGQQERIGPDPEPEPEAAMSWWRELLWWLGWRR